MQQQCNILWQVKYFLIGGEMLSWDFVNSFYMYLKYKPIIVNVYGPTECCVDASSYWINDLNFNLKGKNVYIGKPIPNAKFQIYKNSNEIAKVGEVGELYISGVLVGEGYWGHPEDDSFYFDKDYGRTYKTGDLAILHADNNFEIIGRKDEQVKVHGNRLELEEVRVKLANIIANNNVEVIFDSKNEKLYAFVYDNIGKNAKNEKKIMDILRCQLPAYGMPNHIIFCKDYFPINANGKVDKEMLLLKYLNA